MDRIIREIEREASTQGWTQELRGKWLGKQNRIGPDSPPRKSLKGDAYKREAITFADNILVNNGSTWRHKRNGRTISRVRPFEFNDLMVFVRLKKQSTSRTAAIFTSTRFGLEEVHMDIRDFSNAVKFMTRGILKGRFVWKVYEDPHKQLVKLLEAL